MVLHAGSLSCQRTPDGFNSYYVIDNTDLQIRVSWREFKDNAFIEGQNLNLDLRKALEG